jgi:DNA-directed RNA polymerase specialized sigma24 family protein
VPESAAARMRLTRERARRREMVDVLRVAEAMAGYAAGQVGNGLAPAGARLAAVEAAGELAEVASALRRLARLSTSERSALVRHLTALGFSRVEVARRAGVSERTVYRCLRPGPGTSSGR